MLIEYQQGPMADYLPYTPDTLEKINRLANLKPKGLAAMHGSTYVGDGESALPDLGSAMKDVLS